MFFLGVWGLWNTSQIAGSIKFQKLSETPYVFNLFSLGFNLVGTSIKFRILMTHNVWLRKIKIEALRLDNTIDTDKDNTVNNLLPLAVFSCFKFAAAEIFF